MAQHFHELGYAVDQFGRNSSTPINFSDPHFIDNFNIILKKNKRYSLFIFFSGLLRSSSILEQSFSEISESFLVNSIGPVVGSELILERIPNARVFLIGSESARKGSFDMTYSMSKSTLKTYVLNKRLLPQQQLLLLSPSTIQDMGMTTRRNDYQRLNQYKSNHPKKRFLDSYELAQLIVNIFNSSVYLTNTEIEINGGKFAFS